MGFQEYAINNNSINEATGPDHIYAENCNRPHFSINSLRFRLERLTNENRVH